MGKVVDASIRLIRVGMLDCMPVAHYGVAARFAQEVDLKLMRPSCSAKELFAQLDSEACDVLLIDYALSREEADGIALLKRISQRWPLLKILVWSSINSAAHCRLAQLAGAHGFLDKMQSDVHQVVEAVRAVATGRKYVHGTLRSPFATVTSSYQSIGAGASGFENTASRVLSPREAEVLRCCLQGLSITDVAKKFHRSIKTISTQKNSAYRKLGLRCDRELFQIASGSNVDSFYGIIKAVADRRIGSFQGVASAKPCHPA